MFPIADVTAPLIALCAVLSIPPIKLFAWPITEDWILFVISVFISFAFCLASLFLFNSAIFSSGTPSSNNFASSISSSIFGSFGVKSIFLI